MLIAACSVLIIAFFTILFFLTQKHLVFQSRAPNWLLYYKLRNYEITVPISSNQNLQGWKIPGNAALTNRIAIYWGGNAEDVADITTTLSELDCEFTYSCNYRGYGLSDGKSSEVDLFSDSEKILNFARKHHPASHVFLIGFSLGSTVAGFCATKSQVSGCILVCPLSSISDLSKAYFGLRIPRILIRYKFSLVERAKKINCPTLTLIAEKDAVIPSRLSEAVFNKLNQPKQIIYLQGVNHNETFQIAETISTINRFIRNTCVNVDSRGH